MKQILFVDDDPKVLQGLQRMLYPMRREWNMMFADNGRAALDLLAEHPVSVLVTDMRMPEMDGTELLSEVAHRHPDVVRIVLSGQCDEDTVVGLVNVTHQYLAKPCDPQKLKTTVRRACALKDLLGNEAVKRLVAEVGSLPSLPAVYQELMQELRSPRASVRRLGQIIAQDVGMTAKVLQLVNSAFFGLSSRVTKPERAVSLLGLRTVRAVALVAGVFSQYDQKSLRVFNLTAIRDHSLATGRMAQIVAEKMNVSQERIDDAFLAGVMHDIGKLLLAVNLPDQYASIVARSHRARRRIWEAEQATFGACHAEVGAYLLGLWGLPDNIVEAVAFHHRPKDCPHHAFCPLTAVHVADTLDHADDLTPCAGSAPEVTATYLAGTGLAGRFRDWADACLAARQKWRLR